MRKRKSTNPHDESYSPRQKDLFSGNDYISTESEKHDKIKLDINDIERD